MNPGPLDAFLVWFFEAHLLGVALEDLAKFALFLAAGVLLGRVLRYPVVHWLKRMTPNADHSSNERVGRSIERAVFLLIFSIVLDSGAVDVLHLPGWAWNKARHLPTLLMTFASAALFLQIVEISLIGLRRRWQGGGNQVDESLIAFMRKGIRLVVILVAALVAADTIGFKVTGIVAGLGIGGAALALASQGLIANFLGTIEIVADRLFRVGDRIHFDAFDGFVEEMGLRSTKIRSLTGERIIVPNKKMAEVQIQNFSRNGLVRTTLTVGIVYHTPHERITEAVRILDSIFEGRSTIDSRQVVLKALAASALELEMIFWARYKTAVEYQGLIHDLNLEIKKRFDAAGLAFAFPTQTIQIEQPAAKA